MALTPAAIVGFVAGTALLGTALALVLLRPPRRGILAYAAYAALIGLQQWLVYLGLVFPGEPVFFMLSWPLMGGAGAALVFAAARYVGREGWPYALPFVGAALLGLVIVLLDPGRMLEPHGGVDNLGVVLWQAPLFLATIVAVALLARARLRQPVDELRLESLLLLFALVPHMGYTSMVSLMVAFTTPEAFTALWAWAYLVTFGAAVLTTLAVSSSLWRSGQRRERALALVCLASVAAGAVQYLLVPQFVLFGGVFRIFAALLLGYGLLKFGLFGTDLKLKWSLDRGALLAIFGGVFFVVDQAAQFFVSAAFGALAGFVAAGLLLLAIRPLEKATARLADRVLPRVQDTADYHEERRLVVYRSAAQAAARDGVITEKEREMLSTLVRELGIPAHDVDRVEREVLSGVSPA